MILNNIGCVTTACGRHFILADVSNDGDFIVGLHPLEYCPAINTSAGEYPGLQYVMVPELAAFCWDSFISFHRDRWKVLVTGTPSPKIAAEYSERVLTLIKSRRNPELNQ
jgi:hypothetical protein